jgi:hypothetical protein
VLANKNADLALLRGGGKSKKGRKKPKPVNKGMLRSFPLSIISIMGNSREQQR